MVNQQTNRFFETLTTYISALFLDEVSIGQALIHLGWSEGAVSWYRMALDARPRDVEMHIGIGIALHEMGRFEEARIALQRATEMSPENAIA